MTQALTPLDWRSILPPLDELSGNAQDAIEQTFRFTLEVMIRNFKLNRTVGNRERESRGILLVIKSQPEVLIDALGAWRRVDRSEDETINRVLGIATPTTRARSGPNRSQCRVLDIGRVVNEAIGKYMTYFADSRTTTLHPGVYAHYAKDNNREGIDINYIEKDWMQILAEEQRRIDQFMNELLTVMTTTTLPNRIETCQSRTTLDFISLGLSFMRSGFRSPEKAVERATLSLAR